MGAENSVLAGCDWGDPLQAPPLLPWQLTPVTKPDGTSVTVFRSKSQDRKTDAELLRKAAQTLKGVRHPSLLHYHGAGEASEGFWLATEKVTPLVMSVSDLSSAELCAGLYDLLQGLAFLHDKMNMSHNNLSLASVFVASDGTWKLGCLEHTCLFKDATQAYLDKCRAFRAEDSLAPEEKSNSVQVSPTMGHARDVFAFGVLVDALMDYVHDKDHVTQMLEHQLSLCVTSDPSSRPKVATLISLPVFQTDLLEIMDFLKNVTLKSDMQKKVFFSSLVPKLHRLPQAVTGRRLAGLMLARWVVLDEWAGRELLPHLCRPWEAPLDSQKHSESPGILSEVPFTTFVIPHLYNMFHVHDNHIRLVLLEHFPHYVHLFTRQQLEDDIFLQVLLGLRDTDDKLVASSLRALANLVPLMGGDTVIGGARKTFFFKGLPKSQTCQDELPSLDDATPSYTSVSPDLTPQSYIPVSHASLHNSLIPSGQKMRLVDLAAGSNLAADKERERERERKNREKEQRREEAKRKREERRKKLKEKQLEINEEEVDKNTDPDTFHKIEDALDKDLSILKGGKPSKIMSDGDDDERDDADWSDFDNKDIDDEIEAELAGMSGSSYGPAGGHKLQTSPSPYRTHSPPSPPSVKVDWSDIPESAAVIPSLSGLRLGSLQHQGGGRSNHDISSSQREENSNLENGTDEWGDGGWEDTNTSNNVTPHYDSSSSGKPAESSKSSNSLKLSSGKSKAAKAAARKPPSDNDLGLGYDIKSIDVEAKVAPEDDFFADMTPTIPVATASLEKLLGVGEGEPPVVKASESQLFAVAELAEEDEASGWGADEDW